ncbi:MAG: NAD(P)-dependent oxidoreductase [Flavobacteriaceae bacterium]
MILVTGANGFIGKHLFNRLIKIYGNENVVAFTSEPTEVGNYLLHSNYSFDNNYFLENGFKNIHTIIHAGAFTPKTSSEKDDKVKSETNVTNTAKLLAANLPNLKKILFLSTLDIYNTDDIISENSEVQPNSLYAQSKWDCENMIALWAKKREKLYQIARIGHVYGPGEERYKKVIPETMKNLLSDKPIKLYGEGNEIRTFIYIHDVIKSILHLLDFNYFVGPVNFVGNEGIKIKDLINTIIEISGNKAVLEKVDVNFDSKDFLFDNQKLKSIISTPFTNLKDGLSKEWNYMKSKYDAGIL